jgi:threonine dehydrogenase-like Zn-dependent dehydrogenase
MRALIKEGATVRLARAPTPVPSPDEVRIRVAFAGVCRTDLFVADGRLPSRDPVVLGHEISGIVDMLGSANPGDTPRPPEAAFAPGDRVTVTPVLPGGQMLGVDRDGGFADFLCVPAAAVHRVPAALSLRDAAYVEPVAAAMAVLHAGISTGERGLVHGRGRIARLVHRVLVTHGFERADLAPSTEEPLPHDAYDFAIETGGGTQAIRALVDAVRPGGRIVLKSRQAEPVGLDLLRVVPKELTLRAVHYGSFPAAVALLASGRLRIDDLLGPARPLEAFAEVLADARRSEHDKLFFAISTESG